ncbi:MAG: hypothetical protein ACR2FE_07530 [Aeromicrobium sp.]
METTHATLENTGATRTRIGLVAVVLAVTAVAAVPGGLMWPETSTGNETYAYADIEPIRQLWWGLLLCLATVASIGVVAQAIVTLTLVRGRGSVWATWGAALMWFGITVQAAGVAFLAGAYYFPTSPEVSRVAGSAVFEAIAQDQVHLVIFLIVGALTVTSGTVLQAIGLLRSHAVPAWVPIATLFTLITFVVPGNGVLGLVTSLPMAAGAIGLAFHAWRAADDEIGR